MEKLDDYVPTDYEIGFVAGVLASRRIVKPSNEQFAEALLLLVDRPTLPGAWFE